MFINKLIAEKPPEIKNNNFSKYILVLCSSILGALIHAALIVLFFSIDLYQMAIFNCFSVIVWLFVFRENFLGRHSKAIILSCVEIIAHAVCAVSFLGLDFGFQYYLWALAGLASIHPGANKALMTLMALLCITIFIILEIVFQHTENTYISEAAANYVLVMNILGSAIPLILFVLSIQIINDKHEKRLTNLANNDELTGLYNRRYFNDYLRKHCKVFNKTACDFCVAIGDIDYFKNINDSYGHAVGDEVLRKVSRYLLEHTRDVDIVCRWGGEEFMIFFCDIDKTKALHILEEIRAQLPSSIRIDGIEVLNVTMSFGLVESISITQTKGANKPMSDEIMLQADKLLYQAKNSGRNCIKAS